MTQTVRTIRVKVMIMVNDHGLDASSAYENWSSGIQNLAGLDDLEGVAGDVLELT
jgi:hypothetical protein